MIKVNFGCGSNKLEGWKNHDEEVDITEPLPYRDATVDYILAEHVMEHVPYISAIDFLKDCYRILKVGGVARIIVPSVERVMMYADADYIQFVSKWADGNTGVRGAMGTILWKHGHEVAWCDALLESSLFYAGFNPLKTEPRFSRHYQLNDIDGHWKVIGERNNWIESSVFEGQKQGAI